MAVAANLYSQDRDPTTGLTRNQRAVLNGLTVKRKTQKEIADELGISRQRVNQIVVGLKEKGYDLSGRC